MRTEDFDYHLPPDRIAQFPAKERDQSRLLVMQRRNEQVSHHTFSELGRWLRSGDLLVVNDSRVIRARLRGAKARTGGRFETVLLREAARNSWWALVRPVKRARPGSEICVGSPAGKDSGVRAIIVETNQAGHRLLRFEGVEDIADHLEQLGEVPLPPYIKRGQGREMPEDAARYQTVYARQGGSIAAPTAGLHFTPRLLSELRDLGVETCAVTLHVGLGTFAPVKAALVGDHPMEEEHYLITPETAAAVNRAKREGRRVVAVGTTSLRALESSAALHQGRLMAGSAWTRLFVYPPFDFQIVDALVTNFHWPRSTLLMLVSAFAAPGELRGRERVLAAYAEAVRQGYHFYSFGDAMMIL